MLMVHAVGGAIGGVANITPFIQVVIFSIAALGVAEGVVFNLLDDLLNTFLSFGVHDLFLERLFDGEILFDVAFNLKIIHELLQVFLFHGEDCRTEFSTSSAI
jgi:hypothetical protein